jgi:hypothetical protein
MNKIILYIFFLEERVLKNHWFGQKLLRKHLLNLINILDKVIDH